MNFMPGLCKNDIIPDFISPVNINVLCKLESIDDNVRKSIEDIVKLHCIECKINIDDIYVEYCLNDSVRRELKFDKHANCIFKCIIFLNNNADECLIVTDIDHEKYVFKLFNEVEHAIFISRQKIGTHIFVNPYQYVYANTANPIRTLDVYVYNKEYNQELILNQHKPLYLDTKTIYVGDLLNYEYYNDIFYYKRLKHKFIDDLVSNVQHDDECYRVVKGDNIKKNQNCKMISALRNASDVNIFSNKFTYKKILARSTCKWLVELFNQTSSSVTRMELVLTEKTQLCNLLMFTLVNFLLPFVVKSFSIDVNDNFIVDIIDASIICETDSNVMDVKQFNKLDKGGTLNLDILLSDINEIDKSYFKFKDGATYDICIGDAIVYCLKQKNEIYVCKTPVYLLRVCLLVKPKTYYENIIY